MTARVGGLAVGPIFVFRSLLTRSGCSANSENKSVHRTRPCTPSPIVLPPLVFFCSFVCSSWCDGSACVWRIHTDRPSDERLGSVDAPVVSIFGSRQHSDRGSSALPPAFGIVRAGKKTSTHWKAHFPRGKAVSSELCRVRGVSNSRKEPPNRSQTTNDVVATPQCGHPASGTQARVDTKT